MMQKAQHTFKR